MFAAPDATLGSGARLLSHDAHGRLYAAASDEIRCIDTRCLSQRDEQHGISGPSTSVNVQALPLQQPSTFSVSRDGSHAILAGMSRLDSQCTALLLVDIRSRSSKKKQSSTVTARSVHPRLFQTRPHLSILQASWHPGSDEHFAVLTDDNYWRLYCIDDLTVPEQTFELQTSIKRSLGLNLNDDSEDDADDNQHGTQVTAFAFGAAHAWERFTVFFTCANGSLFALCPVAPFQAKVSIPAVEHLRNSNLQQPDAASASTTQAWLDQALPRAIGSRASSATSPSQTGSQSSNSVPLMHSMVDVQPHALDNHVPALCGPLQRASDEASTSGQGFIPAGDQATAVLATRYGDACSAAVVATAQGIVQSFVVAGEMVPCWAKQAPACITEGRHLVAIRSEVPIVRPAADNIVLQDVLRLQLTVPQRQQQQRQQRQQHPSDEHKLQLYPDHTAPDRFYATHSQGAHVISLSWLPVLADFLSPSSLHTDYGLPDMLPATAHTLWRPSQPGQRCLSAAPVGSPLGSGALVVLDSERAPHYLWPRRPAATAQVQDAAAGSDTHADATRATEALFGHVLRGPQPLPDPAQPSAPTGTGNLEGQKLLNDSISHLRHKHVEFAHAAHHDLTHNILELQRAAEEQQEQHEELQQQLSDLQGNQEDLHKRLQRASKFQDNLEERLQILANLHWALPHGLTNAEEALRDVELPEQDAQAQALKRQIKALLGRAKTLQHTDSQAVQASNGSSHSPNRLTVPVRQLGKLKRSVEAQEEGIITCQQKLALLQSALSDS